MLIGLSLSNCINDILVGKVNVEDVCMIISGTHCPTLDLFEGVLKQYEDRWGAQAHRGKDIARAFWHLGMIHQPRTEHEDLQYDMPKWHKRLRHGQRVNWLHT